VGGFRDLNHFYAEVGLSLCNARVMESLIRAGCFDSMGVHRNGLLQQFPLIREAYSKAMKKGKKQIPGQTMLFQLATRFVADPVAVPECEAFTRLQCLADEREKIGTYVSGHPLDDYALGLPYLTTIDVSPKQPDAVEEDAEEGTEAPVAPWPAENELIAMAGILTRTRKITTRTTGAAMMLGEIQNKYGSIKVVFFPKTFEAYGDCLGEDVFVSVIGKFKMDGDTPEIMADKVVPLDQARVMVVRLPADMDGTGVLPIKAALGGGDTPVVFVNQHRPGEHVVAHPSLWVKPSEELEARIYRLCRGVTLEVRRLF
jgi:DNA polymerase-3 subunit alpha